MRENPRLYEMDSPECCTVVEKHAKSEPCVGTDEWCKDPIRVVLYGSSDECRKFRKADPRPSWVRADPGCANRGKGTESCEGTELYCLKHAPSRRECFMFRQKPLLVPAKAGGCNGDIETDERCLGSEEWCRVTWRANLYGSSLSCMQHREWFVKLPGLKPYSSLCAGAKDFNTEACRGSNNWCLDPVRLEMYGSQKACLDYRQYISIVKNRWDYGRAPDSCSQETEKCLGTYKVCNLFWSDEEKKGCASHRASPLELLGIEECKWKGAGGCWELIRDCHKRRVQLGYDNLDVEDCYALRGIDLAHVNQTLKARLFPETRDHFLDLSETIVANATLRSLILNQAGPEIALQVVKADLKKYFQKLNDSIDDIALKAWTHIHADLLRG
ncbi:hypothetical protein CDD83_6822 [Cordyceps sp. RAO-2017]|nr:hypothetical protein CDD83_6822 [Cordyceps sp. RAO-2017]